MKKNKKYRIYRFIFMTLLISFMVVYFSELTGYYEYQNYKKAELTEEQIQKFEKDIAEGKEIDISEYLIVDTRNYETNLSKFASSISKQISDIVQDGVENTFKYLSKLVDES